MTLIGGFRAVSGVVLCADSRESDGLAKGDVDKLVEYQRDWCTVGFAGAGNDSDIIEATIEQVVDALDRDKPDTLETIKQTTRDALASLPASENSASLLMAVCPSENSHAELWAVVDRFLHTVTSGQQVMGVGQYVRFVSELLYRDDLTLHETVLVAARLLGVAKKHVSDVEGTSHVLVLTDSGWLKRELIDEIEKREEFFQWCDSALGRVFVSFADTSLTQQQFEGKLTDFTETIQKLRQNYYQAFKDSHLNTAISDPDNQGDPYAALPDKTQERFGRKKVTYHQTGTSGYPLISLSRSPSLSSSVSPSVSPSPSPSVSGSPGDDESDFE